MISEFPLKPIKRLLKKYYCGEISMDACVYVRDVLLVFTEYLAKEGVMEFEEYNKRRVIQGLPLLRRLDRMAFESARSKIFNLLKYNNIGEVGKYNDLLLCQDDIVQRNKKMDIIEDAGVEVA